MKKRYIIPASVAAIASAATAMPIHLFAFNDVVEGTQINQGILFSLLDRTNKQLKDVTIEVYDVSSVAAKDNGTYDLSGLTPIKSYTTPESDEDSPMFGLGLDEGKYVVKVTPPDGYVVGKYGRLEKNAANEFIVDVPKLEGSEAFIACSLVFFEEDVASVSTLTLSVRDMTFNPVAGVVFNVQKELPDGTLSDVGKYTSDEAGNVTCPADSNSPAGTQYIFTIAEYPDGYQKAYFDTALLQAVEGYNNGFINVGAAEAKIGNCTVKVYNIFSVPMPNFPILVTSESGVQYRYTTNDTGVALIDGLPAGNYTVTYGGDNAYIACDTQSFTISEYDTIATLTVTDSTPVSSGKILVMDENGEAVSNLFFKVYNDQNSVVWSGLLNADGEASINSLPYGKYKLVLENLPNKYVSENGTYEQEFTISSETFLNTSVLFLNTELYGDCSIELEITDADTDDYLLGETVKILNENNVVLQTVEMDEDGVATFKNLPAGTYHFELTEDSEYYIIENQSVYVGGNNKVAWQEIQAKRVTTTLALSAQCDNSELVKELSISLYKDGAYFGMYQMKNGVVNVPNLTVGEYEIVVNDNLTGYKLVSDTHFSVSTSDRIINKTLVFNEAFSALNVTVTDSDSGLAVSGVTVNIKDARGQIVETTTTNENGQVQTNLQLGTYTVSAVVPTGYTEIAEQIISLTSEDEPYNLSLSTTQLKCSFNMEVLDSNGEAVYGGTIQILNSKNEIVGEMQLNGATSTTFDKLPVGNYTIKAVGCDKDVYVIPETVTLEFTEEKEYTYSLIFDKVTPVVTTGDVNITMYDENGNKLTIVSDVLVAIYDSNGDMINCDYVLPDGTISFSELEAGNYTASVFMADAPYAATEKSDVKFEIVAGEITDINMTLYKGVGTAKFNVTDSETGKAVAGLTVELFKDGVSVGTYTSDANGQIVITSMETGTYSYVVVDVPDGYENVPNNTFDISVDETTTIDIELIAQTGQAILHVVDTEGTFLTDTVMVVLTAEDGTEYRASIENGILNTGWIKTGTYTVAVLNNIDGYTLLSATDVVVKTDETLTYDIVFKKDSGSATVKVEIQNLEGNLGLANVRVQLRADNNEVVGSYVVDENGCITLNDLDIGRYTINVLEYSLPAGYSLLSGAEFTITKDSNENVLLYVLRDTGKLQVHVKDNNNLAMENLEVVVKDENGKTVATSTTNSNGDVSFDNLPTGSYVVNVVTGNGYSISGNTNITIEKDLTTNSQFTVSRHVGSLKVVLNEYVSGVAFDIYEGDKLVGTGVTNDDGEALIENLPTGSYTIKFTNIPAQYKDLADATVVIENATETLLNVNLEEKGSKLNVQYVYKESDYPADGVCFKITTLDGTEIGTYTTKASGAIEVNLPEGYYLIKTISVPAGYALPEDTMVEIIDGEKEDVKFELNVVEQFGIFALLIQDGQTNEALSDATVALYTQNGGLYKTFTSDNRGQIYEEEIAVGEYYAVINKTGYAEKILTTVSIIDGEMFFETVALDAIVEVGTLAVIVTDEEGNDLSGATVYLRDENDTLVQTLTTDNMGVVVFSNLPYGNYKLSAEANGYVSSGRISTMVSAAEQSATIKLAKSTTGSLTATVKNDSGETVPNAVIYIKNNENQYELTSDGSGLAALSEIEEGEYTVTVNVDGCEAYSQKLTVVANQNNNLEIVLIEIALGSVEFVVTDTDGNALANTTVAMSDGKTYTTDENGKVTISDKVVGSYSATLTKDGYTSKNVSFNIEKNSTTKITATLEKVITTGTLEVVVTDSEGKPLANTTVVVDDRTLTTDENGCVKFTDLEAGQHQVDFFKDGYVAKSSQVTITAKATTKLTVALEKEVTTGTINVLVKDSDGNVAENAKVEVSDGTTTQTLYTDDSGYVSVELEAGEYSITISKDNYLPVTAQTTVEAGKVYTINATLVKEVTTGNLEVTVLDEDKNVLSNATVVVGDKTYTTDENGKVVIEDLEAGEYQVAVSKDGYDNFTATVTINPNKITETSVTLVKTVTTGDLTVTVTDTDGNKLEDASVKVNGATLKTDANGCVVFTNLEAGEYQIDIMKDGYVSESHTVIIVANKEIAMTVDLDKVDTTGDLVVNVTDTEGNALTDANVTVNGVQLKTNSAGTVTFEDLEAGEYTVLISKDGYQSQSAVLTIEAGKVHTIDAQLAVEVKHGSAKITVEDAYGKVVHNAAVTIKDAQNKVVAELMTDSNGEVYISTLEIGDYTVDVVYMYTPTEGLSATSTLSISENQQTNLTINLPAPYVPETTGDILLTVQDKDGNALKDATVTLNNGSILAATTTEDGTVIFEDLEPGEYVVTVELHGYHSYTTTIVVEAGEISDEVVVLKAITTGNVQIAVQDKDGNALANATIVMDGKTYTTNENGILLLTDVEAGQYKVTALANGYKSAEAYVDVVALQTSDCTISLEKEILRGTGVVVVTDENGNALGNASVTINGETKTTDSDGKVTFENLEVGTYEVTVQKDGYYDKTTQINIATNESTTITVELAQKTGNMHIFVYDEADNALANATVVVDGKTYTSDENGKVVISGLAPKTYYIEISKDGYVSQSTTLTVKAEEVATYNAHLKEIITTGTLSVTVVDENGNALKNATISVNGLTVTTDENGIANVTDLEAGDYEVLVSKDGYTSSKFNATIVAEQITKQSVMLEKVITTGNLTVSVKDVNGNPLKDTTIKIDGKEYTTDSDGNVTVYNIEAGSYNVSIQKAGYNVQNKTVVIVAKETALLPVTLTEIDLTGQTTITVADMQTHKPLNNATIVIDGKTYTTDENGTVTITLDNGVYHAEVSKDGYVSVDADILVNMGETLTQTVYLHKQTRDMTIVVKNDKGEVLEGAAVTVYNQVVDNPLYWDAKTNSDGYADFTHLEFGKYSYSVTLDGYNKEKGTFIIDESSDKFELVVVLHEKVTEATAEFVVTDSENNPLSNATVTVGNYSGVTDANGKLVLMLPIDYNDTIWEYAYTVTKDGYTTVSGQFTVDHSAKVTVPVVLEKIPEYSKINVYVRNDSGLDLENATVIISNGTSETTLHTNAAGVAELDKLLYGDYKVTVIADGYIAQIHTVTLKDENGEYLNVTLKPVVPPVEYGDAKVTVTDQDGNIMVGVAVTIVGKDGKYEDVLLTDENGQISVSLEEGAYFVTAEHAGYISDGAAINVLPNVTAEATLMLEKIVIVETSSAEIKLTNQNGEDVLNAEIVISNSKGEVVYMGTLNGTSSLYLSELEADTYTVTATKANHKAATATFTTTLNSTTEVELMLEEIIEEVKAGAFEISVKNENGTPLSRVIVTILNADGTRYGSYTTMSDGTISLTSVPVGDYILYASYNGINSQRVEASIVADQITTVNIVVDATNPGKPDDEDTPVGPGGDNVQTGDNSNVGLYGLMAILSAVGALFTRKSQKNKKD